MQYVEDDMDDIFRKAAEEYPLNTDSGDWNEVLKKLSDADPEQPTVVMATKKNYKPFLLLLLLITFTLIGYEYFQPNNNNLTNSIAGKNVSKKVAYSATPVSTTSSPKLNTRPENIITQHPVVSAFPQTLQVNSQSFVQKGNENNILNKQNVRIRSAQSTPQTSSIVSDQTATLEDVNKKDANRVIAKNEKEVNKIITENSTTAKEDYDKKENTITPAPSKTKNKRPATESGIYAGVYLSPDISTVKFQSVKNTGITVGLLIGYQFNKRVSLEAGLAYNKKHYYSNGDYFNTKNIVLPANAKITKLDGVCKMIEVPVTVRYNFKSSVKTNLSVLVGLSSYIMKDESYDYTIDHTGLQYPRSADYKNSSTNLLSVATAGFGYSHSLGKGTSLRLEPYIKIPVTGVGIGKLPIMSTGMNIGITKNLSIK